jgi:Raf kinase inhibitor-like YbhB/YbcL family protein
MPRPAAKFALIVIIFTAFCFAGVYSFGLHRLANKKGGSVGVASGQKNNLEIISPVFRAGTAIPPQYTCAGQNVNPPLNIFNAPAGTLSMTLIVRDPDAPSGDFLHWLVWDIPPSTDSIGVNSVPIGAMQGTNGSGRASYMGPCPLSGTHRYLFDLYALDKPLNLPAGANLEQVQKAMDGHILEQSTLRGTFTAKN